MVCRNGWRFQYTHTDVIQLSNTEFVVRACILQIVGLPNPVIYLLLRRNSVHYQCHAGGIMVQIADASVRASIPLTVCVMFLWSVASVETDKSGGGSCGGRSVFACFHSWWYAKVGKVTFDAAAYPPVLLLQIFRSCIIRYSSMPMFPFAKSEPACSRVDV